MTPKPMTPGCVKCGWKDGMHRNGCSNTPIDRLGKQRTVHELAIDSTKPVACGECGRDFGHHDNCPNRPDVPDAPHNKSYGLVAWTADHDVEMYQCHECSALLIRTNEAKRNHDAWHTKQERAIAKNSPVSRSPGPVKKKRGTKPNPPVNSRAFGNNPYRVDPREIRGEWNHDHKQPSLQLPHDPDEGYIQCGICKRIVPMWSSRHDCEKGEFTVCHVCSLPVAEQYESAATRAEPRGKRGHKQCVM